MRFRSRPLLTLLLLTTTASLAMRCQPEAPLIQQPPPDLLTEVGLLDVRILLVQGIDPSDVEVRLEHGGVVTNVTDQLRRTGRVLRGRIALEEPGAYRLVAENGAPDDPSSSERDVTVVELPDADACEVLNAVECLLPFPSDRFLTRAGDSPTGYRMRIPQVALPVLNGDLLDPSPYDVLGGFSPTAPVLMHFPAGVDLRASDADILLPPDLVGPPQTRPYANVRTHDGRSLLADSPTVLMNARTGERILHFVELDSRASGPGRQALILRPAVSLAPGERYIVAIRNLVDPNGDPIEPEAPFRALRDGRPTTIAAIETRRMHFEHDIFRVLERAPLPVAREDLQLAFDYTVDSDAGLTSQVLAMQSQAYAWLENQVDVLGRQTFSVKPFGVGDADSREFDCSLPNVQTWRILRGTYQVPLFLTEDLASVNTIGVLNLDADGNPVQNGVTNARYTLSIPCTAREGGIPADHAVVLGHGLFGEGDGMVTAFSDVFSDNYVSAATDWRGLSALDRVWVGTSIVGIGDNQLNNFPALVDRLKQGQINTQILARMLKRGDFNANAAFQVATEVGGLPGEDDELFYYGVSLGGIMGTFFAALTPDVERFNVDVPAMNFSLLLQRSTQFRIFEQLLAGIGLTDPMEVLLGTSLQHELWVRGEPAGYVHRLAEDVAAGQKQILLTVAWLDPQVSNQASEILARSLGLPNLQGSVMEGMVDIPDVSGVVDNAMVIYDQGSFDIYFPPHLFAAPPLRNQIGSGVCDPHPQRVTIPASFDQLRAFLQPEGRIENFCDGVCDGMTAKERPGGGPSCDPQNP